MTHAYNIGDEVQVNGYSGWYKITDINIYKNISEEDESNYEEVSYCAQGIESRKRIDFDEYEVANVKKKEVRVVRSRYNQINFLLDELLKLKELNAVTANAFKAEEEAILAELTELTKRGA